MEGKMVKRNAIIAILGIFLLVFAISVIKSSEMTNESSIITSVDVNLSNKKIGWGIKRAENHEQPDLGSNNLKLLQEYDGIAIGNSEDKFVYLTFDNGYEAGYTAKILDTLKENNVKATFFITAHYLNTAPELVQRMINDGHIIGNQFPTMVMYHSKIL
jgi:peptidoglycan/xylan/chitin deacetylase (PgdA/CDA1 family)